MNSGALRHSCLDRNKYVYSNGARIRCFLGSLLLICAPHSLIGQSETSDGAVEDRGEIRRPEDACGAGSSTPVGVLEIRATDRVDQDLLLVDGVNIDRDIAVIVCRQPLVRTFERLLSAGQSVGVQVRAWHKPKEGGWREMRLNEPSVEEVQRYQNRGTTESNWSLEEMNVRITSNTVINPIITIPLRRDGVKQEDLIRIRVRIRPESPAAPNGVREETAAAADGPLTVENEQVFDSTYAVGRFGLHVGFSDLAVFVQRMGEDRANKNGTNPVLFDQVNFRPAPGISYGFNYYHRRHAVFKFLEPGFGAHPVFLNWNDRPRNNAQSDVESTNVTNLQIGVGSMGSMFDGTVVAVLGWNLHVKDHRSYFGIGFSITGLVRKLSQFIR